MTPTSFNSRSSRRAQPRIEDEQVPSLHTELVNRPAVAPSQHHIPSQLATYIDPKLVNCQYSSDTVLDTQQFSWQSSTELASPFTSSSHALQLPSREYDDLAKTNNLDQYPVNAFLVPTVHNAVEMPGPTTAFSYSFNAQAMTQPAFPSDSVFSLPVDYQGPDPAFLGPPPPLASRPNQTLGHNTHCLSNADYYFNDLFDTGDPTASISSSAQPINSPYDHRKLDNQSMNSDLDGRYFQSISGKHDQQLHEQLSKQSPVTSQESQGLATQSSKPLPGTASDAGSRFQRRGSSMTPHQKLECPSCPGITFGRETDRRRHKLDKHENKEVTLKCPSPHCNKTFSAIRKDKLKAHIRSIHNLPEEQSQRKEWFRDVDNTARRLLQPKNNEAPPPIDNKVYDGRMGAGTVRYLGYQ